MFLTYSRLCDNLRKKKMVRETLAGLSQRNPNSIGVR